jgi:hypothetical protein
MNEISFRAQVHRDSIGPAGLADSESPRTRLPLNGLYADQIDESPRVSWIVTCVWVVTL